MLMGGGIGGAMGPMGWNIGGPKPEGAKKDKDNRVLCIYLLLILTQDKTDYGFNFQLIH